jgi:hypothetical protein
MVVASSPQMSLPLYPVYAACPELRREPRSERTRKALRALCVLCVRIHLQPRPALPAKSVPIPSSSDLCALRVSAFSSLNVGARDAESSISPLSATLLPRAAAQGTKNTRGWVSVPIVNPISQFNRRFISNSHRITSFAYPHPLTPIESYSCKKQGEGVPLAPSRRRGTSYLCVTHRNPRNPNFFMRLLHNSRTARGWGAATHHSLPTTHCSPLKPLLQMAHPYTCTCKKGPAAREPRYSTCAAS